jgi:FkbM family methyltransferase
MSTLFEVIKMFGKLALGQGVSNSYGQNGEDAIAQALLRNVKSGTYVDVGTYHPTLYSNTYTFYRRGWRGIVIDPNSAFRPLYRLVRPRDTFVHAGIGKEQSVKTYYCFNDGAYNTFDEKAASERKSSRYPKYRGETSVEVIPLSTICSMYGVESIDFLNIDVEERDLEVLQSHNWSILPRLIAIESRSFDPSHPQGDAIFRFLSEKGYVLAGLANYTLIFALHNFESVALQR